MNKKKLLRTVVLILAGVFVVAQFFGKRPGVKKTNPNDLLATAPVPGDVTSLLRHACYDCHSNETVYPWYARVAPVSWLVYHDVSAGRKEMNFSEWASLKRSKKAKILDKIREEVLEKGDMPMPIYVLLHKKAKLSDTDRKKIGAWADAYGEKLFAN